MSVGDSQDKGSPVLLLMTCGDIFRIIIALFIPPSGRFHSGGIDAALLDQPGDLSLHCWRPWISSVVRPVTSRCDSRHVCHPALQINYVLVIWF